MARCEQGYLCDVCGLEVDGLTDSALYLRYVLGDIAPEFLPRGRERHVRCEPSLAQFIVAEGFSPCDCVGPFCKSQLDPAFVAAEETRVTRGWQRLQTLPNLGLSVSDYPLPEVRLAWQRQTAPP